MTKVKKSRAIPKPGRKMSKAEAREYTFKTFGPALKMLAEKK